MTMPSLWSLLHASTVDLLGWTLLHFVWQGALVAAVLAGALYGLRDHTPRVRYAVSCAALLGLLALPIGTGVVLSERFLSAPAVPSAGGMEDVAMGGEAVSVATGASVSPASPSWQAWVASGVRPALPWIVLAWGLGVIGFALRLGGGAWQVRRLRRTSRDAPSEWQQRLQALAQQMNVRASVALRRSDRVEGPVLAGWWRPVLLVPAGLLSGLPPDQVEALLRHELAHVRRHDVLVGRLQAVVETLLFFHPATWWISRQIRQTREACCDDLALQAGTDRTVYARALAGLAERTLATPRAAGALAASDGSLLARVRRLLAPAPTPSKSARRLSMAVAVFLLLGVPTFLGACVSQQGSTSGEANPKQNAEVSDFLLVVGTTEEGFHLTCKEGCAWKELSFANTWGVKQAVDQFGMTTRSEDRAAQASSDLADFLITFERVGDEDETVRLRCREGCAWKALTFGAEDGRLRQPVDERGITRIAGRFSDEGAFPEDVFPRDAFPKDAFPDSAFADGFEDFEREVFGRELHADSLERAILGQIKLDSLERAGRLRFDRDSLAQRMRRMERRADSVARRFAEQFRNEFDPEAFGRSEFDPEAFEKQLNLDSLRRWHEHHADSLRRHLEQLREQWTDEMHERFREQARRLREQAEELEERAEELERRLGPPRDTTRNPERQRGR